MSWLSDLFGFGNANGPMNSANKYLSQIPGMGHQQYDPYINQGQQAYGAMNPKFMEMLNDPGAFREKLMQGYEPSQDYKNQQEDVMKAIHSNSAAGGMAGSDYSNKQAGEMTNKLLGADKDKYLNSLLGIQGTGLQGEGGFQQQGYGASQSLADLLGGSLNQQGGLAFQNQTNHNNMGAQNMQGIMAMLARILGGINNGYKFH